MGKQKAIVMTELIRPMLEPITSKIDFECDGYSIGHAVMQRDKLKRRVNDIDLDRAMPQGVIICNNPDSNAAAVSKLVVAFLLNLMPASVQCGMRHWI